MDGLHAAENLLDRCRSRLCRYGFCRSISRHVEPMDFLFTLLGAVSIQAMSNMVNDYAYNLKKCRKRYTRWFAESYDRRLDLYVRSKENGRLSIVFAPCSVFS